MNIKLFFRRILIVAFLIVNHDIQAQNCKVELEVVVDGSQCANNGKAKVTVNAKGSEGSTINTSNAVYTIALNGAPVNCSFSGNTTELAPGGKYIVYGQNILCDGKPTDMTYSPSFTVKLGLDITKAEYRRCSASEISVTADVLGGTGPYKCKLLDGNTVIATASSSDKEISFSAQTSSSNLKIEVTDDGCAKNPPVIKDLTTNFKLEPSIIEGDRATCKNGDIKLSVKNAYSGSNFQWKKDNTIKSTSNTLQIRNITEAEAGEYIFSMTFDGCDIVYSETFTIEVGVPPVPNISAASICLNSGETSLSKYVSATSDEYTLVWYKYDASLIGTTAPMFNPNLPGTTKYLVSQKNSTECESQKAELTVVVENLPSKIGENNIIICTSDGAKPRIRIVHAGAYTYNLYTNYSGGTKIGSGTAINDTAIIETTQDLVLGNTYFIETQNTNGCVSDNRTIVNITIKSSWILGPKKVCFGDNLSLSADYVGGQIVWTKPDKSTYKGKTLSISDMQFADAGVYNLVIEEPGLGCKMRDEINVTVTRPEPPTVAVTSYRYAQNETATAMTATAKTDCTLKWYDPEGNSMSGSPKPATDKVGVFVYNVSQDSLGCESTKVPITVVIGTIPSAVSASDINICIADKPSVQIKNTIKDYTYTVYYQNNVIAEGEGNDNTISLTSKVAITENAEIEVIVSDIYNVKSPATKKAVITPANLIAEKHSAVCFGSDFQLVAIDINGADYTWKSPNGIEYNSQSISVTDAKGTDAGIYTLTVTTEACPVVNVEQSVRVTQPEPPKVDKDSYRFFENETATPLTATPKSGCTLKWYNSEGIILPGQSPVPATNKTGVFMYYVSQDSLGCESPKVDVTVIVGEIPASVPASNINVCIAAQPVIHINNTIQDYKYTVYYKNEVIAEGKGNGTSISLTSKVSISENTELDITVSDLYNVSSARTKVSLISVNNLIDMRNSTPSVCDGSTGKLMAVNIVGAVYEWTTPTNTIAEQSVTIRNANNSDAGVYTLAVTTSGCPVATQTIELKVEKPAKPSTTKEVYYCKDVVANELRATALAGYKLVWFDESQTQLPVTPRPNTSAVGISVYYVKQVSISDENCSSDLEEITVVVEDKPEAVVLDIVNVCSIPGNTQTVSVRIPTSSEGYIYSLYTQETDGSLAGRAVSVGDNLPVDIEIRDGEANPAAIYYLEVTNKSGCVSERTPIEIVVTEIRVSPDELLPYQIDEFYSQKLTANAPNLRYEIVEGYLPIGFTLSSMGDITGTASEYADPSVFTVEVTSSLGCSVKKQYSLKSELLVSKMFSPNGDGINDTFMKGYRVIIFDRLGRKLFSGDNGWDGTYHGKVMPEDVYFYILYYKDKDGTEKQVTSYVTLIKTM
jgi:gliding motility-associated-like protein